MGIYLGLLGHHDWFVDIKMEAARKPANMAIHVVLDCILRCIPVCLGGTITGIVTLIIVTSFWLLALGWGLRQKI